MYGLESYEECRKGLMKGSIKVFSVGLAILKNDRIAKRVYVGECVSIHLISRQRKK